MTVWVFAATRAEAGAVRTGVARAGASERVRVHRTGIGLRRAAAAVERELGRAATRPDLLVSTGFAFSAAQPLVPGSFVTAHRLLAADGGSRSFREVRPALRWLDALHACALLSVPFVVTPENVDRLPRPDPADHGLPLVVDMESSAIGEVAARHGMPLLVLRMITDTRSEPLPCSIPRFTAASLADSTGERLRHSIRGVLAVAAHPFENVRFVRRAAGWCHMLSAGWSGMTAAVLAEARPPR